MANLSNADVELIFYDTTSPHFEVNDEDEPRDRPAADGRDDRALRKRGKSKNGRGNAPQLVVEHEVALLRFVQLERGGTDQNSTRVARMPIERAGNPNAPENGE